MPVSAAGFLFTAIGTFGTPPCINIVLDDIDKINQPGIKSALFALVSSAETQIKLGSSK